MTEGDKPPSGSGGKHLSFFTGMRDGISHRINVAMISLTLSILLIVGALSFGFTRHLVSQNIRQTLEAEAGLTALRLEQTLNSISESLVNVSTNLIMTNALVDTVGRDAYIVPFMKSFKLQHGIGVRLTLCDFMGKPLASSVKNPRAFNAPALLQSTVEDGKSFSQLEKSGNEPVLLLALPVVWVMTRV